MRRSRYMQKLYGRPIINRYVYVVQEKKERHTARKKIDR